MKPMFQSKKSLRVMMQTRVLKGPQHLTSCSSKKKREAMAKENQKLDFKEFA